MVVLSYETAKRSLIRMSVYLVCTSLVIKGVGWFLEFNFMSVFQGLLGGDIESFSFKLPEFNMDSISFDWILNEIKEQVQEIINVLIPSSLGMINAHLLYTLTTNKAFLTGVTKII